MSYNSLIFWTWRWVDLSNPNIPSRDIKWEFVIPYILRLSGSLFCGYSFAIKFLCFGFHFITDVSCGRVFKCRLEKWYLHFIIRRGWSCEIGVGIDRMDIHDWKMGRLYKRMTPEQLSGLRRELMELQK